MYEWTISGYNNYIYLYINIGVYNYNHDPTMCQCVHCVYNVCTEFTSSALSGVYNLRTK